VADTGVLKESDLLRKFAKLNIRDALKGMKSGDISLPVRDDKVSYIFQLVSREEGRPFEKGDALRVIRERVTIEKARQMAKLNAEEAIRSKEIKFSRDTDFFPRNGSVIPGVGEVPRESLQAMALTKGQTYQKPVEVDGRYYVLACRDELEPDKAQWEKEKENYRRSAAAAARSEYLNVVKEEMKKTVKVKINWDIL
jgi:parvulin-like peptidyl-prolyl isomerase